jgi:5'-nucleotidase
MSDEASEPTILVTNDDGYDAPGIAVLQGAVAPLGRVFVVAPDREQSASSHSLTVHRPLRVLRVAEGRHRVDGTPTDCVHLAVPRLTGGVTPDLVVSGINRGLNIGDDVVYSGTVAGAMEGALLQIPAIAFSMETDAAGMADYAVAAAFIRRIARTVLERELPRGVLLNVNFPAREPRGVRVTRQGTRTYRATALERQDPAYYWIDSADAVPTGEPDGDHAAITDGYVSVTPLHADLTHVPSLSPLSRWRLEWV